MIDDSPEKHIDNYGNLVQVTPYFGVNPDDELLKLIQYLEKIKLEPNIRSIEKRGWKGSLK